MLSKTLYVQANPNTGEFIYNEMERLCKRMFGMKITPASTLEEADFKLLSDEQKQRANLKDAFSLKVTSAKISIHTNTDVALLIAIYRFAYEFGARFLRPGRSNEILPSLSEEDFEKANIQLDETASFAHRGVCIEGADKIENIVDFIDWLPKIGMNSFFIQFENPYPFLKRWYEHEFNPYQEKEPFSIDIAQKMSDSVDEAMQKRGIVQHRVGHGWTGEVLGYSSKYGWESGVSLPEDKKPLVAEIAGKRELFNGAPILTSLDFANPEVTKQLVDIVVSYAQEHSDVDYLHVWLSDACNNICECEECKKTFPSDQYVDFLNALDKKLTEKGLDTHICFLLYHELLFAPEHAKIANPERFTMMFAPISRTFEKSYADVDYKNGIPQTEAYNRNNTVMPNSLEENLSYLFSWKKAFQGDGFVYDYPLGRAHYGDLGYMAISSTIYRDIAHLSKLGLDGYISCQELRAGFPHNFPNYVMGSMLWNNTRTYDDIKQEYFASLYGNSWKTAVDWLQTVSYLSSCDYFNAIGERINLKQSEQFNAIACLADSMVTTISKQISNETGHIANEWLLLSWHREYVKKLSQALREISCGHNEQAQQYWYEFLDFIRREENNIQPNLDVYRVIEVAKNYAGFKL